MIVRTTAGGLQLITQPDHARVARQVMEPCVSLAARPRRDAILQALAGHDDGWAGEDAAPTVDPETGIVVDFMHAPLSVRQGVWPRAIAQLSADPWAAALVAQHALTAYDRYRGAAEWAGFFTETEATRDGLVRASGQPFGDLFDDYAFVRLGDLISLSFCTGWTDPQRFRDWTVQLAGARVVITPDLFGGAIVPVSIAAQSLTRQRFASDGDLRDALRDAAPAVLRGEVSGSIQWSALH